MRSVNPVMNERVFAPTGGPPVLDRPLAAPWSRP